LSGAGHSKGGRRTVVVTGGGVGLGREIAAGFAHDGYAVVGIGQAASPLGETGAQIGGGRFDYRLADVSDAAAITELLASIADAHGGIHALICAAATRREAHFLDMTEDEWVEAFLENVSGVNNCCRAVLPGMMERNDGRIVIVGSLADLTPEPGASAYCASRAASRVIVRSLATEIDPERFPNVLINEVNYDAYDAAAPESFYRSVKGVVDLPAGGPTGRIYLGPREIEVHAAPESIFGRLTGR